MWKVHVVQECSVCVIHSSDTHGMKSLGWDGPTKIILWELDLEYESLFEDYDSEEFECTEEEFLKEQEKFNNYMKEMIQFWSEIGSIIAEKLNEKYPKSLPEFQTDLI